jgi:hypothetical protein
MTITPAKKMTIQFMTILLVSEPLIFYETRPIEFWSSKGAA